MKKSIILLLLSLVVWPACSGQIISKENDPNLHPYLVNHKPIKSINNRDISFFLINKSIDENSKLFYKGEFAISDDENTFAICDSVLTENPVTRRPFYFYIFCRILELSDGAISEAMGGYCVEYITKFPCEFFDNLNPKEYNISEEKWLGFVAFEYDSKTDFHDFVSKIYAKIKAECPGHITSLTKFKDKISEDVDE